MAFLAGVDEAGYGPLLSPFVVGFSLFRVPAPETDLWRLLRRTTVRSARRGDARLRVDDSKKVHRGPLGRPRLERSVAAFRGILCPNRAGGALSAWLQEPPAGRPIWFSRAPWFRDLAGPLCPSVDPDRARLDSALLARELEANGCTLDGLGARAVPAAEWNVLNRRLPTKGDVLFAVTAEVMRHLLAATGTAPLRIELDRHGARLRYAGLLRRALHPDRIETHAEGRGGSAYTLRFGGRAVQIRFLERADASFFPVSLASLAAKLTRERLMDRWNAWFASRLPDVRPTKGYALDARRWMNEARGRLDGLDVPPPLLCRWR
ncbi:MAG: hypothetical protein ACE5H3_08820 [Planctomycetota bacterium]